MSVTVKGLHKQFAASGDPAVHGVSFLAPTGAITTLLGPSGSGKTTVLRMIAGLEEPDAGTVHIGPKEVTRTAVQLRGVGFVFQGYALFQHLTVRKNIGFGLRLQQLPRAEISSRVEELLALVQLEEYGDRFPMQLSGGQRQRVAFARALATRPAVLLLDEPFGALDTRVRLELREWLQALHEKTQVTTVLVTHDQEEALELSEQVVVMSEGRIEQIGTPHQVYDHPATPFVASFIGSTNRLKVRVQAGRAAVGGSTFAAPQGAAEGAELDAFVRPHEVKLRKAPEGSAPGVALATVEAMARIGGYVRVQLKLPSEEAMTVELLKVELDALGVKEGDRVMVDVGGAKIFLEDYSI